MASIGAGCGRSSTPSYAASRSTTIASRSSSGFRRSKGRTEARPSLPKPIGNIVQTATPVFDGLWRRSNPGRLAPTALDCFGLRPRNDDGENKSMTIALPAQAVRPPIRIDWSWPVLIFFAALLCVMILLPVSWLGYFSLVDRDGAFTAANFIQLVSDPTFRDPLLTTFVIAFCSSLVCCAVAAPIGWLVARTDMPLRRTVRMLVTASFVTPPFLGAIAWELLAAPNSGLLNKVFRALTGAGPDEHLFNIYSLTGVIFVISCYTFPYVFVLMANTLDHIPGELEDASAILGGRMLTTARR